MTELHVYSTERCIESFHDGRAYGEWRAEHDFSIDEVSIVSPNHPHEITTFCIDADVLPGDEIQVLYIRYGTGDSFGHACGHGEVMWVFSDASLAVKAERAIEENSKECYIEFEVDGGKKITISNPASGYFETFEGVFLQSCILR